MSATDIVIDVVGFSLIRAGLPPWSLDTELTANRSKLTKQPRTVWEWLPVHSWPTPYIFEYCAQHDLPLHPVYEWMPSKRFSCQVCISPPTPTWPPSVGTTPGPSNASPPWSSRSTSP